MQFAAAPVMWTGTVSDKIRGNSITRFQAELARLLATGASRLVSIAAIKRMNPQYTHAAEAATRSQQEPQVMDDDDMTYDEWKEQQEREAEELARQEAEEAEKQAPPPEVPAAVRWGQAVQDKKATGLSGCDAIRAVVKENPTLHRQYLAAYNAAPAAKRAARRSGRPQSATTHSAPVARASVVASGNAISRWQTGIAERMKQGETKPQAIRALMLADPDLHREYLDEYNAVHGRQARH